MKKRWPSGVRPGRGGDRNRISSARGFTLLEVLMAMAVMSVGLLGASTLLTHNTRQQSVNTNRAFATTLARDQLEQIKPRGVCGRHRGQLSHGRLREHRRV